jgi:type I restriction enzyme S subunit
MTRPNLNAVAQVGSDLDGGVASTGFDVLRPVGVAPGWIFYRVRSNEFIADVCEDLQGVVYPAIRPHDVRRHKLPVAPVSEQHRIVDAIESYLTRLDDAMATLERVQRNLKRYRASVLKAAVEGRLVTTEAELARAEGREYEPALVLLEHILAERRRRWEEAELAKMKAKGTVPKNDKWKAKYVEPAAPDTSELPELPEGWCWASLPQLGELNRGKSKHRPRNDPRLLGGQYPFIQTGDVRHSGGFITKHSSSYGEFGLAQSRLWPKGTLCITIAANIAETGILRFDACFPDSIVGFLPAEEPSLVRFIEMFLRTAKQGLEQYAPATAQKNINLEVLSIVAVPLPPLAEQSRIVSEIDRLFSVALSGGDAVIHNAKKVARLRQSILKWAFEGRLVDQDPTDEPADVLLERIRAERAASHGKKQSRPRRVNTSSASA